MLLLQSFYFDDYCLGVHLQNKKFKPRFFPPPLHHSILTSRAKKEANVCSKPCPLAGIQSQIPCIDQSVGLIYTNNRKLTFLLAREK